MKTKFLFIAVMLFSITVDAQQITKPSLLFTGSVPATQPKGKYVLQQTNIRSIGGSAEKIAPATTAENYFSLENIFPNPANNNIVLTIKSPADGRVRFNVLSVLGNVVMETTWKEVTIGNDNVTIDISRMTAGIYFIHASFLNSAGNITASASSKLVKTY